MIAHSIKQNGPAFPCMHPAVYSYMVSKTEELGELLSKKDIPQTASTESVIKLIDDLDECNSEEALAKCLDNDIAWTLIAASHWPDAMQVNLKNKGEENVYHILLIQVYFKSYSFSLTNSVLLSACLITNLVEHEVVWSRKRKIDELCNGLDSVGLLRIMKANPDQCKLLFCFDHSKEFGPKDFEHCLDESIKPSAKNLLKTRCTNGLSPTLGTLRNQDDNDNHNVSASSPYCLPASLHTLHTFVVTPAKVIVSPIVSRTLLPLT